MKIVLATHHFPPEHKAGAEQYAYRLAHSLLDRGHDVTVVCIETIHNGNLEPIHRQEIYDGIPIYRLDLDLFRDGEPLRHPFDNPFLGAWFRKFLAENRPDIVHINSGYLLTGSMPQAAYEAGIPTVVTLHDYWFICPRVNLIRADGSLCAEPVEAARCAWCLLETKRRFREPDILTAGRLGDLVTGLAQSQSFSRITGLSPHITAMEERRAFLKQVLHRADRVVCPSHFIMEKMAEYGFPTHNLLYLPFGLDVSTSNGIGREREPKKLRFGYLGQLARHKGVHTLIQAFHELGDRVAQAELVIYGDLNREPAYAQRLRSLAGAHPGIVFAGPYNNREINQVLSSLDMLVVPSEWFENRPTVILEAFAHRVPALAASIGGIPELVHDGVNGLLFEPGNAGSLARQMERLLDEPGLLAVLKNGIDPVKSVAQEMDELEAIYRSLLTGEKSYLFKSEQVF